MKNLFLFMFYCSSLFAKMDNPPPKVVIIGGGIAGLTVAYHLQDENIDLSLYEARGRVGGRILTAKIGETFVELGAGNISDGGEARNLYDLIDEFDLELRQNPFPYEEAYFDGNQVISVGELLKTRECDPKKLREKIENAASHAQNMQEVLSQLFDPDDPLYKIIAVKIAAYEGGTLDQLSPIYSETLLHMLLGGLCAAHPANEEHTLELVSVVGGNATLTEKMAETLGSKIHLNKTLVKVTKGEKDSLNLTFADGIQIQADLLVLAIPCSVYENIIFEEGIIPPYRLRAIESIQYGSNAKIIFPCKEETKESFKQRILLGDQIISFLDLNQMLTLYCTGESASFSKESLHQRYDQSKAIIELGYDKSCFSLLEPKVATDLQFISYQQPIGYSWPNDPYVKGSYAYIAPGQEELLTEITEFEGEKFKTLFLPIGGRIYFAGEHTSILLDVPGTMESACESGARIARAIKKELIHKG